ncbi:MAG: TlpA family protein disulfide reductase [Bacteroidia bacterium]|nr:TlpA family protein disulfide reductase [Bacteroidia bacterium]
MKKYQLVAVFLITFVGLSCNENTQPSAEKLEPNISLAELESGFPKWWSYHSKHIALSSNFTALNENSDTIGKKLFLEKLITSNYIPIRLKSPSGIETYRLLKLGPSAAPGIRSTIKNESLTFLKYFKMEGSSFPEFDLTDLDGNLYTKQNTKGKTVVLKTWFTTCKACIAEFPELNELVSKYKQNSDVVFVSLALNTQAELESFLERKKFDYKVVPDQEDFIKDRLDLTIYPTHIILDGNGIIVKVVNKASEMISFLENETKPVEQL